MKGTQPQGENIDIKALFQKFLSKWYFFAIALPIAFGIAFYKYKSAERIYQVDASLLLKEKQADGYGGPGQILDADQKITINAAKEDEIRLLTSLDLIKKTLRTLDFGISYYSKEGLATRQSYRDFPFWIEIDSTHQQMSGVPIYVEMISDKEFRFKVKEEEVDVLDIENDEVVRKIFDLEVDNVHKVGEPYKDRNIAFTLHLNDGYKSYKADEYFFEVNGLGGLAKSYKKKLGVTPESKESNTVNLTTKGPVIEMEKKFIDRLLDVYIAQDLKGNQKKGQKTSDFLSTRLDEVNDTLTIIQNELAAFRKSSRGLVDIGQASMAYSQTIMALEGSRSTASVRIGYYDNIQSSLSNSEDGTDNPIMPSMMDINDPVLTGLMTEMAEMKRTRSDLTREVKEGHPDLIALDRKITITQNQLEESIASGKRAAQMSLDNVNQRIGRAQGQLSSLGPAEKRLIEIQRRFEYFNNMHKYLSEKQQEADIAMRTIASNKRIIDHAELVGDGPVSPNRNLIFLIALILGAGIPVGLVMVKDFFNNKIVSAEDIESNTNIPILGFIAQGDRAIKVISPETSSSLLAESFRAVRVNLQYLNSSVDQRIIGVTSSMQGEGKTFCAMNLSVVLAQSGKRTLLVDVDLRRPQVAARMGLNNNRGISTYLMGRNSLDEIVQATRIENLDIIASGPKYDNPLDLMGSPRMGALINELRDDYDYIILDTPPLVLASDYLILMQYIDYNMYVVRHGHTDVESLTRINELYDSKKIRNLGLIINDVLSSPSNGYGYGYGYGYGHDKKKRKKKAS